MRRPEATLRIAMASRRRPVYNHDRYVRAVPQGEVKDLVAVVDLGDHGQVWLELY